MSPLSILPGIAFSLDLIETTSQYGVVEGEDNALIMTAILRVSCMYQVLISSFMAAFVFSMIGAQPLCIAGVTGV